VERIPLDDHVGLDPRDRARLERTVGGHTSLERVLAWGRSLEPPRGIAEVLTQDEYTHDVVMAVGPDRYLVYDTT
jgi:hypothetical protein